MAINIVDGVLENIRVGMEVIHSLTFLQINVFISVVVVVVAVFHKANSKKGPKRVGLLQNFIYFISLQNAVGISKLVDFITKHEIGY